jgi:hypothetical protein
MASGGTIFSTKIQLKLNLAALSEIFFWRKSVDNKILFLKDVIWVFEILQNGPNFPNGVRNLNFPNFAPKTSIFNWFQIPWMHSMHFIEKKLYSKIRNGGFFEDGVIFEKKKHFFPKGSSHPKLNFFQILKKQSCSSKTQDIAKKLPTYVSKMVKFFQKVFVILLATYGIWGRKLVSWQKKWKK